MTQAHTMKKDRMKKTRSHKYTHSQTHTHGGLFKTAQNERYKEIGGIGSTFNFGTIVYGAVKVRMASTVQSIRFQFPSRETRPLEVWVMMMGDEGDYHDESLMLAVESWPCKLRNATKILIVGL